MNVPAPYILVSFDIDLVRKLFTTERKSLGSLEQEIGDSENSFLFRPGRDSGLSKFEHDLIKDMATFKMSFIDPPKDFENKLVSLNIIENLDKVIDSVEAPADSKPQEVVDRIRELSESPLRSVYISYGIGDDLTTWAGPFTTNFINAYINVGHKTTRVVDIELAGFSSPITNEIMLNQNLTDADIRKSIFPSLNLQRTQIRSEGVLRNSDIVINGNYHDTIEICSKKYLSAAALLPEKQIVLLLPDVDSMVEESFSDTVLNRANAQQRSLRRYDPRRAPTNEGETARKERQRKANAIRNNDDFKIEVKRELLAKFGISVEEHKFTTSRENKIVMLEKLDTRIKSPIAALRYTKKNIDRDTGEPEQLTNPLTQIARGYRDVGGAAVRLELKVENDIQVLALWKEVFGIGNGNDPILIFGDKNLISTKLYRLTYIEDELRKKVEGSIRTFKLKKKNLKPNEILSKDAIREFKVLEKLLQDLAPLEKPGRYLYLPQGHFLKDFNNKDYSKRIYNLVFRPKTNFYSFAPTKRDDLALLTNLEKISNIPFFRANVVNSNTETLEFDLNGRYFAALTMGLKRNSLVRSYHSDVEDVEATFAKLYPQYTGIFGILKSWMATNRTLPTRSQLKREFGKEFFDTEVELDTFLNFALALYSRTIGGEKPKILTNYDTLLDPLSLQQLVLEDLMYSKGLFEVNIKTVPLYNYSNIGILNSTCMLLYNDLDVIGIKQKVDPSFNPDLIFSGRHTIVGARHVITSGSAFSEFKLVRTIRYGADKRTVEDPEEKSFSPDSKKVADAIRDALGIK